MMWSWLRLCSATADLSGWANLLSPPTQYFTAFEDGTDRGFRNVGKLQSDTGEIPKRTNTSFPVSLGWLYYPILGSLSSVVMPCSLIS
jgi:hypothetical protein